MLERTNHDITRLSTQDANPVPAPAPGFPEVLINIRGARVHVYDTHLDFRPDPTVRRMQVADMLAIMDEDRGQKILLGDLNAQPHHAELQPLFDALPDAWSGGGGLTYPALAPDRRIDYVLTSPDVEVRSARTVATGASDHRPVIAELLLRRGGQD
jgi:endonuclease/exonuclease/phosphatase family metal-dependent hydrolase